MFSTGSPGSRRIAPGSTETRLKSPSKSAKMSGGSAASRRLYRWPCATIGILSCPKRGLMWQRVVEIWGQIVRPRIDVGDGGAHGLRASQHLCSGQATRDDLAAPGDVPVPVAGRTVRRNVVI